MEAVIYIGHGSRADIGNRQFIAFIRETMKKVDAPIQEYGFLELAEPSIGDAIENAVKKGATRITVMPVLLLSGIHANVDIPQEVERAWKQYPDIAFDYGKPLGSDEMTVDIMEKRLAEKPFANTNNTTVLIVGHGSRDEKTPVELETMAQSLAEKNSLKVSTCYLQTTPPSFSDKLAMSLRKSYNQIYVLPYLLFTGGFTMKMEETISAILQNYPEKNVILCHSIGFDEKLSVLLQKRVKEARGLKINEKVLSYQP